LLIAVPSAVPSFRLVLGKPINQFYFRQQGEAHRRKVRRRNTYTHSTSNKEIQTDTSYVQ